MPCPSRNPFVSSCRRAMTLAMVLSLAPAVRAPAEAPAPPPAPLLETMLVSPVYRGRVTAAGPQAIRLKVRLNLAAHNLKIESVRLTGELLNASGGVVRTAPSPELQEGPSAEVIIPARDLTAGTYTAVVKLLGPDEKALQETRHEIVRLPNSFRPKAAVDEHQRLLLDGKPFFPLGMYWGGIDEADLKLYADSRFNCLMPYGAPSQSQMDLAHKHGLKVIYTIKDCYAGLPGCPASIKTEADEEPRIRETLRQFRNHPALLAWYLNDELTQGYVPRLEAHQRWVEEEDPHHPTWAVLCQLGEVGNCLRTFDVIGTDPYPIGQGQPPSMAGAWTLETLRQVASARPMWQVPQAHNLGNYMAEADKKKGRTPGYDEKRSMAWQCICEGAMGLVFYSWFDVKRNPDVPFEAQWRDLKKIAAEIDRAAPALLSVEPAPPVTAQCRPAEPRWLHWRVHSRGGKLRLFAVNNGDAEGEATFTIGRQIKAVTVPAEKRDITPEGDGFKDTFKKLEVRMYELN